MHYAASSGFIGAVQVLLDRNASVEVVNLDNWTPLHCAANEGSVDVVELLVEHNVDKSALTKVRGATQLSGAYTLILRFIVSPLQNNWNAMHFAAREGHVDIVEYLISHKMDMEAKTDVKDCKYCTLQLFNLRTG
jgi:ankyrin repeat protein